jgi:hypothetical protein
MIAALVRPRTVRPLLAALTALAAMLFAGAAAAAPSCAAGWIPSTKGQAGACMPCAANTYQSGAACKACAAGTIADPGSTACCRPDAYASTQNGSCRPANQYSCQPGSAPSVSADGNVTCAPCPAGTYSYAMRSAQAQPLSLRACWPCPAGQTSKAGSTTCTPTAKPDPPPGPVTCRGNTVINKDGTRCIACPPASAANADHTACVAKRPSGGLSAPLGPGLLESSPTLGTQGPASTGTPLGPRPGTR